MFYGFWCYYEQNNLFKQKRIYPAPIKYYFEYFYPNYSNFLDSEIYRPKFKKKNYRNFISKRNKTFDRTNWTPLS